MNAGPTTRSRFFLGMSVVLLAVVCVGFSRTLYLRAFFDVPAIPSYIYAHGIVLTAWFAWFVVQTCCIAAGRTDLHRRLGIAGAALAVLVVIVSAMTSLRFAPRLAARGLDVEARLHFLSEIVWLNIAFLVCFSVFVTAALLLRRRIQIHKRLMLLASISILAPAISRIADWSVWGFGDNALFPVLVCLVVLIAALGLHDVKANRSVHPATLAGGTAIITLFAMGGFVLPNTAFGRSIVLALYTLMR